MPLNQSFQWPTMLNSPTVARLGPSSGKMTWINVWNGVAPSIQAASSTSWGRPRMKFIRMIMLYTGSAPGRISAQMVSFRPRPETSR